MQSPRVIEVASPSTEITLQDLIDTLRFLEYSPTPGWNVHSYDYIVDASGKEPLGGGVYVAITLRLRNAVLKFEDRPGPDWIQCNISGGNLTAIDEDGDDISCVAVSPYTQIVRTASSSATLQELADLQYASFNGGVTLDTDSEYSGTEYPVGTPRQPVNNLADAMLIADERGFTKIYVKGDLTLDSGGDYEGMAFEGESETKTTITISDAANVVDCEFTNAHVTGTLDGGAKLKNCLIDDLTYVDGYIELCVLNPGTIVLSGSDAAHFLDCWCGAAGGDALPTIDLGGTGSDLVIRNFNGCIKLKNKTGADDQVSIDLNSGYVVIDATVTAGDVFIIRGVGWYTNNGTVVVDDSELLCPASISARVLDEPLSTHTTEGTLGAALARQLGLAHENARLKDQTWETYGGLRRMTAATQRIYASKADADADENAIAEYAIVATYNAQGDCTGFLQTRTS